MVVDNPHNERPAENLPLPWLLVVVAWAWLFALALYLTA
jgi:hypothetical protein